jgi:hypothetical protein
MLQDALYMEVNTGRVEDYDTWLDEIEDSALDVGQTRDEKMQEDILDGTFIEVSEREDGSYK